MRSAGTERDRDRWNEWSVSKLRFARYAGYGELSSADVAF